jgi:hypothetical protein
MRRFVSVLCAAAAVQLAPAVAQANSEVVAAYDARSTGMALTGAAYVDNATAILHNPANLIDVKRLSIDVSFNPAINQLTSQIFTGQPGQASIGMTSPFAFAPFGFVGVAYRGHERFAIGAAAMITDGMGGKYKDAPLSIYGNPAGRAVLGTVNSGFLAYEVRVPVAIKVTNWLTVAGGYRMTFANQFTNFKSNGVTMFDQSVGGNNFASAQAGLMIRPMPELQFGLAYRSRTKVELSGNSTSTNAAGQTATVPTPTTHYVAPHQFTAGVATRLLDQKLLLTGDFKYWMYADAYAGQHDHQDAMSGHVGAEYHINRYVPIRAGYFVGRSGILEQSASAFTTSPKLQMGGSVGSGLHMDLVDLDLSVGYGEAGGNVADNSLPGKYHQRLVTFGISASVKI